MDEEVCNELTKSEWRRSGRRAGRQTGIPFRKCEGEDFALSMSRLQRKAPFSILSKRVRRPMIPTIAPSLP